MQRYQDLEQTSIVMRIPSEGAVPPHITLLTVPRHAL